MYRHTAKLSDYYTSGRVKYSGNYFPIPAPVFIDPKNWNNDHFVYITGIKKTPSEGQLEATIVAGHTIFWRVIR